MSLGGLSLLCSVEPGPWRLLAALEASSLILVSSLRTHHLFVADVHIEMGFPRGADLWREILNLTC